MKKLIGIFVLVLLIALLPACGNSSDEDVDNIDGAEATVEEDSDEMKITNDDSETTVAKDIDKGVKLPDEYPEDILPIYENLVLTSSMKRGDDSFGVSGGSKDSIQSVAEFYETVLEDANVVMKDKTNDTYSNMGEFKGYTYTITVSEPEEDMADRFESFIMIILVPGDSSGMTTEDENVAEENRDYAGGLVIPDDLVLPADYPESEMPFYADGEENVLVSVEERDDQKVVGYMTTDPLEEVYAYFEEEYSDADQFTVINNTDTDKNLIISTGRRVFQVVLFANNETTGEDLKYKTMITIIY